MTSRRRFLEVVSLFGANGSVLAACAPATPPAPTSAPAAPTSPPAPPKPTEAPKPADQTKRIALVKQMQDLAARLIPWIPTSISTYGGAWKGDKVTNVTGGGNFETFVWTYKVAA